MLPARALSPCLMATASHLALNNLLVQQPIRKTLKGNCTSPADASLQGQTMTSLRADFAAMSHRPSDDQFDTLRDVVATAVAMAEGSCLPAVYLSSLDPGVGKTTTVIHFIRQLLEHPDYEGVSVLLCLPRLAEIERVVSELKLPAEDVAILTSDDKTNQLSSTPSTDARVLITTHQMVKLRCTGVNFSDVQAFTYKGRPREVRLWDEEMLPGRVVSVSTDDIGLLIQAVRRHSFDAAEQLRELQQWLQATKTGTTVQWPNISSRVLGAESGLVKQLDGDARDILTDVVALSGRIVRIANMNGRGRTALDTRDLLPDDFLPVLVLDASGRVRSTYRQWELQRGGLVRLTSATKNYGPLTVNVLERSGAKSAWQGDNGDELVAELAEIIASKPSEPWLVVHYGSASNGDFEQKLRKRVGSAGQTLNFLTWGKHQGTNAYGHNTNVILAGTLFYPESQYEGLTHLCTARPVESRCDVEMIKDVRLGEHRHLILQALCRASVRGSDGPNCKPCNAYIVASKRSGIRKALPTIFPGCKVKVLKPRHKQARGKVAKAIAYLEEVFGKGRDAVVLIADLKDHLASTDKSNFNKGIMRHPDFGAALERLDLHCVSTAGSRHRNAIASATSLGPIPGGTYRVQ